MNTVCGLLRHEIESYENKAGETIRADSDSFKQTKQALSASDEAAIRARRRVYNSTSFIYVIIVFHNFNEHRLTIIPL
jgi:hypothetical protein